jgi:hypothetical protein
MPAAASGIGLSCGSSDDPQDLIRFHSPLATCPRKAATRSSRRVVLMIRALRSASTWREAPTYHLYFLRALTR